MERGLEEVQFLGIAGVVAEAFRILRSAPKLLGAITLTLLLPLRFAIFNQGSNSKPHFEQRMNESLALYGNGTSLESETIHKIYLGLGEIFLWEAARKFLAFAFSLPFTAAVVYTVACMYTRKELSNIRVLSVVPRIWKRLIVTGIWYFAVMFAYYVVAVHFWVFWSISSIQTMIDFIFWRVLFGFVGVLVVSLAVHVYMGMVWDVASVMCVVEERWGLVAMRKSKDLIKGKCGTALALKFLFVLITGGIESVVGYSFALITGGEEQVEGAITAARMTLLVALWCGFDLFWLLIQIVFYFHCKSFHHESINRSALSDPLEAYLGKYVPLRGREE